MLTKNKREAHKRTVPVCPHLNCGFQIVAEDGYDYLSQESSGFVYGMAYTFGEAIK